VRRRTWRGAQHDDDGAQQPATRALGALDARGSASAPQAPDAQATPLLQVLGGDEEGAQVDMLEDDHLRPEGDQRVARQVQVDAGASAADTRGSWVMPAELLGHHPPGEAAPHRTLQPQARQVLVVQLKLRPLLAELASQTPAH